MFAGNTFSTNNCHPWTSLRCVGECVFASERLSAWVVAKHGRQGCVFLWKREAPLQTLGQHQLSGGWETQTENERSPVSEGQPKPPFESMSRCGCGSTLPRNGRRSARQIQVNSFIRVQKASRYWSLPHSLKCQTTGQGTCFYQTTTTRSFKLMIFGTYMEFG